MDGVPYEVFHIGARYVACLLAQALYAAMDAPYLLPQILGTAVDLLVWILKFAKAEFPSDMRPLQLPTCFRRLFGALLADLLGPSVERLERLGRCASRGAPGNSTFSRRLKT